MRPARAMPIRAQENLTPATGRTGKFRLQIEQHRIAKTRQKWRRRHNLVVAARLTPNPNIQTPLDQPSEPHRQRAIFRHDFRQTQQLQIRTKKEHYSGLSGVRNRLLQSPPPYGKQLARLERLP